jgi:hypothetical protein
MKNPFTCDNCIFNPSQFHDLGTRIGYCLQHGVILRNSLHTTCRYHRRKDLPYFVAEEGQKEHYQQFHHITNVVYYWSRYPDERRLYSEKYAWENRTFDPNLHDVAIYHRTVKKWTFLQALAGSRSPIKSIMHSSMVRRYIYQCGPRQDNYRLILALTTTLDERVDLQLNDFRSELTPEEFVELREHYARDVVLLRLYAVQEYGCLTSNEQIMWASDELNGSFLSSNREYFAAVRTLVPILQTLILNAAQERGNFFPQHETDEPELPE